MYYCNIDFSLQPPDAPLLFSVIVLLGCRSSGLTGWNLQIVLWSPLRQAMLTSSFPLLTQLEYPSSCICFWLIRNLWVAWLFWTSHSSLEVLLYLRGRVDLKFLFVFQVLCIGPTGSGKTLTLSDKLLKNMPDEYITHFLMFSARTSANQTQDYIDSKLDKRYAQSSPQCPSKYTLLIMKQYIFWPTISSIFLPASGGKVCLDHL